MNNEMEVFLRKNYDKKRKWKPEYPLNDPNGIVVTCDSNQISSIEVKQILTDIQHIIRSRGVLGKYNIIYFNIYRFNPKDKLVYILLECVIYYLIKEYGYNIEFRIGRFYKNINTQGFAKTALGDMAKGTISNEDFKRKHCFWIDNSQYRKIVVADENMMSTSIMLSEIKTFLHRFNMPEEFKSNFAKIITELVDNASEHGNADCLVDIDVTDSDYSIRDDENENVKIYGINVVVLNFSEKCLGDNIRNKIKKHYYKDSERYDCVEKAYLYHKTKFKKRIYTEEDFFNITAFQEKISGRVNETKSGGTGLAELIKSLQEYAYDDYCYAMTGDKGLFFKKELLIYNENNWVGFNEERDYVSSIPRLDTLVRSHTFLPGTGYNFMFVFKEGI